MRRFFPLVCVLAALIGIVSLFLPWFGSHTGVDLILGDVEGMSGDYQRYVLILSVVLMVIGGAIAVRGIIDPLKGLTSYGWLLLGFITLAMVVVVGMWSSDGQKINTIGEIGLYLAYASASLFIVYGIVGYSTRYKQ